MYALRLGQPLTPQIKPFTAGGFTSSGEGQSSSSDSDSSSEESLQFDDGLDDDLIGDDEDRTKLDLMTEAEREKETFNRCVSCLVSLSPCARL